MTSISNGESGSSVRTKLNSSLTVTDAFTVSSGNVGIGATPSTKLDVRGGSIVAGLSSMVLYGRLDAGFPSAAFNTGYFALGTNNTDASNGGLSIYTMAASALYERMRIDTSGNVGIGTTAPSSKLELRSSNTNAITMSHSAGTGYDTTITSNFSATQSFSLVSAGFSVLSFRPGDGAAVVSARLRVDRGASAPEFWLNGASGTDQVGLKAGSGGLFAMEFYTAAAERMRITSGGNVGIGTASPNAAAIVDAQSTTKGVRFPNMTTTEKNAIANVAGLVVFDTTLGKLCVNSGSGWQTITSA